MAYNNKTRLAEQRHLPAGASPQCALRKAPKPQNFGVECADWRTSDSLTVIETVMTRMGGVRYIPPTRLA